MFSWPPSFNFTVACGQSNTDYWLISSLTSLMKPLSDYFAGHSPLVTKKYCICSWVALPVLFRRAFNRIYRSSVYVVAHGRPCPCRYLLFHMSWNQSHRLALTILVTPIASSKLLCVSKDSSVPIIHQAMESSKLKYCGVVNTPFLKTQADQLDFIIETVK